MTYAELPDGESDLTDIVGVFDANKEMFLQIMRCWRSRDGITEMDADDCSQFCFKVVFGRKFKADTNDNGAFLVHARIAFFEMGLSPSKVKFPDGSDMTLGQSIATLTKNCGRELQQIPETYQRATALTANVSWPNLQ